jgi:hypothetical protein
MTRNNYENITTKYINGDPLSYLLSDEHSAAGYLAQKILSDDNSSSADYLLLEQSPQALKILSMIEDSAASGAAYDRPGKGLIYLLFTAASIGLNAETSVIKKSVELLSRKAASPDGGFTYSWKPGISASCVTGDIAYLICTTKTETAQIHSAVQWILSKQRPDGGWLSCPVQGLYGQMKFVLFNRHRNSYTNDSSSAAVSCPYATIACLRALSAYAKSYMNSNPRDNKTDASPIDSDISNASADGLSFLFSNRHLFTKYQCVKIIHSPGVQPAPSMPGILSLYELLNLKGNLSVKTGIKAGDIFNSLIASQNSDGTWEPRDSTFSDRVFPYDFRKKIATISAIKTIISYL